jgi:hypothetical protein
MPTRAQVQNQIDTFLTGLWSDLQDHQERYAAAHDGRYQQFLPTADTPPADGADAVPDLSRRPHYQSEGWEALQDRLPARLPCTLRVDQYISDQGAGFVATVTISWAGVTWSRSINYGSEVRLTQGWHRVDAPT